ncbi:MAG: peptidoglycan recognition family protein [Planctomycetota bacterium]
MGRSPSSSTAGSSSENRSDTRLLITLLGGAVLVACIINILYGRYTMTADDRLRERYEIHPDAVIRPWRTIVVHHSATESGNAALFDKYHREQKHMENGLAYHFVIGNGQGSGDGEIEVSPRWTQQLQGGHVDREEVNELGIGIGLVGDFMKSPPTPAQTKSLLRLLRDLQNDFDIPVERIVGHGEVNSKPTVCPGARMPMDDIRAKLREGAALAATRKYR